MKYLVLLLVFSAAALGEEPADSPLQFALARPAESGASKLAPPPPPTEFDHFRLAPARSRPGVARLAWDLDRPQPLPALEVDGRAVLSADRQFVRPGPEAPRPPFTTRLKRLLVCNFR